MVALEGCGLGHRQPLETVKARILRTGGGLGKSLSIFVDGCVAELCSPVPRLRHCSRRAVARLKPMLGEPP